jgi:hypothetical protein
MTRASDPWLTVWPPTDRFTPHPDWPGQWPLIPKPIVDHAMWIGLTSVAVGASMVLAGIHIWRAIVAPVDEIGD